MVNISYISSHNIHPTKYFKPFLEEYLVGGLLAFGGLYLDTTEDTPWEYSDDVGLSWHVVWRGYVHTQLGVVCMWLGTPAEYAPGA
jgi:hypothetical protein